MSESHDDAFTLVEIMVVVAVAGLVLLMTVPAVKSFSASHDLKAASLNIQGQLMLAHEKAIATGLQQNMHFTYDYQDCDYHIHDPDGTLSSKWKLPAGVTYSWDAGTKSQYRMTSDGQCLDTGMIILTNTKGDRDTVSVRLSGLVLRY